MKDLNRQWRPRVIIFDLLTALLDSWETWAQSTAPDSVEKSRAWRDRYLDLTFGAGAYTAVTVYENLIRQAATDVHLPQSAPNELLRRWSQLELWPEVPQVLLQLRSKGFEIGVITNCSHELGFAAIHNAEQQTGSGFRFHATMTAEDCGVYKPHKAAYESILTKMRVSAGDALFVAGSAGDVQGANDAGMKVVWHNRVGLARRGDAAPLREGKTLTETLEKFV